MNRLSLCIAMILLNIFVIILTPTGLFASVMVQKSESLPKNASHFFININDSGRVTISPQVIELGEIQPGTNRRISAIVQNNRPRPVSFRIQNLSGWRAMGVPSTISYREFTSGGLTLELNVSRDEFLRMVRPNNTTFRLRLTIEGMGKTVSFLRELSSGQYTENIPFEINGESFQVTLAFSLAEKLSAPALFLTPRTLDLGVFPSGAKIDHRLTIRNSGAGVLRWTVSILPKTFKTSKEITQKGRFLSLHNYDVESTGIYILPRHLRDQIDLTGRWSEEGGYPRGLGPLATIRFRFVGTTVGLVNLRKTDDASVVFFVNDVPSPLMHLQEEDTGYLDNIIVAELSDSKNTLTIVVTEGELVMEGFRTFERELMRLPEGAVSLAPRRGVSTSETDFVTISIDTRNINPGYYMDFVEIISNGGTVVLPVYVEITAPGPTTLIDVHLFFKDNVRLFSTNPVADALLISSRGFQKHSVTFQLFPPNTPGTTDFFRWYNPRTGDYFYSHQKQGGSKDLTGYLFEGTIGNIATSRIAGTRPLHRWFNPKTRQHFFTVDPKGEGIRKHGFSYDGISGFVR